MQRMLVQPMESVIVGVVYNMHLNKELVEARGQLLLNRIHLTARDAKLALQLLGMARRQRGLGRR